ncbi:hypothetical protein LPJ81_004631, partial [Coemansia sp. IMI 209127]
MEQGKRMAPKPEPGSLPDVEEVLLPFEDNSSNDSVTGGPPTVTRKELQITSPKLMLKPRPKPKSTKAGVQTKRKIPAKQSKLSLPPQPRPLTPSENEMDDEFINITDCTSDATSVDGALSETEFDVHGGSTALSDRLDWSDTNLADSGDEDIAREETAYLTTIGDDGALSSSSLSDLDDERVSRISGRAMDTIIDSGDESDSESSSGETNSKHKRRRARLASVRDRSRWRRMRRQQHGSDSMVDSAGELLSEDDDDDSEIESDQELVFREARTDQERALAVACNQQDGHEDALLQMHLDQLHAVRNVIQECSSPLLEHAAMESDS